MKVVAMFAFMPPFRLLTVLMIALPLAPLWAHEFWIAPQSYQVAPGTAIAGDFKNGQNFKGNTLSFFDRSSTRFDVAFGDQITPLTPRNGDRPALQMQAPDTEGLLVVLHEKSAGTLTYREWAKFMKFVKHKDFATAEADHAAAGWPKENFRETYTRHAKALVAVGSGAGADKAYGMATEFVALTNPYAQGFDGQMSVQLLYQGAPRSDAQVEVFDRTPAGEVTVTLHRTDAQGVATVPVTAGHSYLFDGVVLRPAAGAADDPNAPVWETLWAALTFAVPQ
jgi:uncharacterized GH25 family protein